MEQDKQYKTDGDRAMLEAALARLDDTGVTGLGELLKQFPDIEPEYLTSAADANGDEASEDELGTIGENARRALSEPLPMDVGSLGELRVQAHLTVDDVAEIVGLPTETIDYMEEDFPVTDTPRAFLRIIGELYGYAAEQVESVLRAQGSGPVVGAAYKLRPEATAPSMPEPGVIQPRSFVQILEETGATNEQCRRWLESTDEETAETAWDDLFA